MNLKIKFNFDEHVCFRECFWQFHNRKVSPQIHKDVGVQTDVPATVVDTPITVTRETRKRSGLPDESPVRRSPRKMKKLSQ
jgi:hypothetical protein